MIPVATKKVCNKDSYLSTAMFEIGNRRFAIERLLSMKRAEKASKKAKEDVIGRRVRVECSDGVKYQGVVKSFDRKKGEYLLLFEDGAGAICNTFRFLCLGFQKSLRFH